jgi:hypothetical protein
MKRKLLLKTETIRTLSTMKLRQVQGGRAMSAIPCFPTDSEIAGGCTVTDTGC